MRFAWPCIVTQCCEPTNEVCVALYCYSVLRTNKMRFVWPCIVTQCCEPTNEVCMALYCYSVL